MNATSLNRRLKEAQTFCASSLNTLRFGILSAALALAFYGQTASGQTTQINLATQGRNVDFTGAPTTKPVKTGTATPATCAIGELFFKTNAVAGQNLFGCTAANTWTLLSPAAIAALADPGVNGLLVRTAPNVTSAVAAPAGAVVGTTDTQTLTNKSISASQINSGTLSASRLPAFSGDIITAAGSTAAALPAVNTTPGTFGDATHSAQITVDTKGRITAVAELPVSATAAGLTDPGANGLVLRTAPNATSAVVPPTGALVGTSDAQTITNKSIDASEINSGTLAATRLPAFSGDIVTTAGSAAATLPTVNTTPGSFGDTTHSARITVDGKGRITAVSQLPVSASAGLGDPGGNGVVVRTAANVTTSVAAPAGAIVGTTDTQTLTNKSIDASEVNSGMLSGSLLPSVNTTPGVFGDATHSAQVTVDAKGRVTAVSQVPVSASAGLGDPGSNGVVVRTAANVTTSVAAPAGAIVGATDTQTLTNKSIDASEINSGTLVAARIPILNQNTTGNAATASALAAAPSVCPIGQAPTGVLANGNATGCAPVSSGSGGANTPATTNVLVGTGVANGVAAGVPNVDYLPPANPAITGTPTVNGNRIGAFRVTSLPSSCVAGTDSSVLFTNAGTDALYVCDSTGHYSITPGGSTTALGGDVTGTASANTVSKIGGAPVGNLATQNTPAAGIVTSNGTSLSSRTAPTGALVGATDTQTLTNKSIDASEINSGTLAAARVPTLNQSTTGNAATATALAATPALCPAGQAPTGVLANGNATGCAPISSGSGGANTPATTNVLVGTGIANGVAAGVPNVDYLPSASPAITGTPTVNGNKLGAFRVASLPSSCVAGTDSSVLFNSGGTDALYVCDSTGHYSIPPGGSTTVLGGDVTGVGSANTVSKIGGTAVGNLATQNAPTAGIVTSNGTSLSSRTAPAGVVVGTTDTQTLTNKSIDASEVNSGTFSGSRLPALSGDVQTSAGSTSTTLAAVNTTPGTFGDGTHSAQITVDAKGRVTAISALPVSPTGLADPGANGLVLRTAANTTSSVTPPAGSLVGTTDTQTLTNKSIDASEINSGTFSASRIPAFSGDIVTTAGSTAASLPAVNTTPGTFGDGTHAPQLTVDAKGRITAVSQVPVTSTGLGDPGANGIVIRTAANVTSAVAAPGSTLVGTADTQTLINKSIDASEINSGTLTASRIPAFSGDIVTAAGSTAASLPAVNTTPGTFGDATHAPQLTVDAKGRITAVSQVPVTSAGLGDPGANGIVIRTAANVTSAVAAPSSTLVGTADTQTLTNKSIAASEINSGVLAAGRIPAFTGDISTTAGATAATLATVNGSPGTFGDSTHTVQLTVDAKGRVTGLTLLAISGSGGGSITSGALSSLPASCSTGTLFFVTDQPAGQQLYTCSATNTWTQLVNLGGSGALQVTGGSLDINPSVVPRLGAANTFTALTTAVSGLSLLTPNTQPLCTATSRGTFWYLNNGSSKDNVQVCVYTGTTFTWTNLY